MRSRYAAYAMGKVRYIMDTGEERHDHDAWAAEIRQFCAAVRFVSLEILQEEPGGDIGHVTFRAGLMAGEIDVGFTERSRFERGQRWRYVGGERIDPGGAPG